jgi:hypothetical protein
MKKTVFSLVSAIVLSIFVLAIPSAFAAEVKTSLPSELSVFKNTYSVKEVEVSLPTVVKAFVSNNQSFGVAVMEEKENKFQPVVVVKKEETVSISVGVGDSSKIRGKKSNFVDKDFSTSAEFDLDKDNGEAYVTLEYSEPITSSTLNLELEEHVSLPYRIAIEANVGGEWITALASTRLYDTAITFPQRTAKEWKIYFTHSQPLKIREITPINDNAKTKGGESAVVWLARPGETYKLYTDAAIYPKIETGEAGNLLENLDTIVEWSLGKVQKNPLFKEPDDDEDSVPNILDNCVDVSNQDQKDLDENGRGDACEDHDKDGVIDSQDNCPDHQNSYQQDEDSDGIGDACDGEESRVTENKPWLPWVAMGFAAIVVFVVIIHAARKKS